MKNVKMTRRQWMAAAGLSALGVGLGGVVWRIGGVWWDQPAASGKKVLSVSETRIVEAISEALFPGVPGSLPSGVEAGCASFFDDLLEGTLQEPSGNALRALVHAIDELAIGAHGELTRFHLRPLEQRVAILQGWQSSRLALRRGAFSALKVMLSMGYCENPAVIEAAGIDFTCGDWA